MTDYAPSPERMAADLRSDDPAHVREALDTLLAYRGDSLPPPLALHHVDHVSNAVLGDPAIVSALIETVAEYPFVPRVSDAQRGAALARVLLDIGREAPSYLVVSTLRGLDSRDLAIEAAVRILGTASTEEQIDSARRALTYLLEHEEDHPSIRRGAEGWPADSPILAYARLATR